MLVYYIYSFRDPRIEEVITDINNSLKNDRYRPFRFSSSNESNGWKSKARKKIKEADLVVFFVSEVYYRNRKNIDYELSLAKRYGKKVIYVPTDDSRPPTILDEFNGESYRVDNWMSCEDLKAYIRKHFHDYSPSNFVFEGKDPENMSMDEKRLLFEQYREMFASTESLMERRQNTSSFYISINTVLVAIIGILISMGLDTKVLCAFCIGMAVFGIVMSKTWSDTLESYDRINSSKFSVLESMERYLPASMFYAEYKDSKNDFIMKSVPSYSKREHKIPMLFMFLYSLVAIIFTIAMILSCMGMMPSRTFGCGPVSVGDSHIDTIPKASSWDVSSKWCMRKGASSLLRTTT